MYEKKNGKKKKEFWRAIILYRKRRLVKIARSDQKDAGGAKRRGPSARSLNSIPVSI